MGWCGQPHAGAAAGHQGLAGSKAWPWYLDGAWAGPAQRPRTLRLGCGAILTSSPQHPGCSLAAASLNWSAWGLGFRRAPAGAVQQKPLRQARVEPEGRGHCLSSVKVCVSKVLIVVVPLSHVLILCDPV